ncbi:GTP-binding protein [Arcanobacterium bovis]|uniref:Cobalamin biosynthesis protein CobW n=1 Tax=Arcanobacterium bovis TaxID=2529275 RepID=A0A4Q9V0U0_9ACTO|nr:GTP-binding protein [Arcanobacterium bovis]TBW21105.1 cobalamin biosynthesis protein CobW [Arcanobacterium bovis]
MTQHSLGIISTLDESIRDLTALIFSADGASIFTSAFTDDATIRFASLSPFEDSEVHEFPIDGDCATCALRSAIIEFTLRRTTSSSETLLLLPPGVELIHLVPGLSAELELIPEIPIKLMGVTHIIDSATATDDLLGHRELHEVNANLFEGDERCLAEVHMMNLGYADIILTVGPDNGLGQELIEHLRPHDVLLLNGIDKPLLDEIRKIEHDPADGVDRIHPATTQAWGGPDSHGTWTLDLYSENPFHPERLRDMVADLAGENVCARGCFWLPSRPDRICSWEAIGGVVSVGDAGKWSELYVTEDSAPLSPRCHLIVTGVGNPDVCEKIEKAFHAILIDNHDDAYAWVGADDGLGAWFGE